jgi:fatty-acyl-CoA synthase
MMEDTHRTLAAVATRNARQFPDRVAIICEDRELTFGELDRESNRTGRAILASGLSRGSRVAYFGKESEYYYEIALACAKSGTVLVPINWRLTTVEVEHVLRDSGAELIFVTSEHRSDVERLRGELAALHTLVQVDTPKGLAAGLREWNAGRSPEELTPGTGADDPVVQLYTSGTTGLPKGAVLAHRTFFTYPEAAGSEIDKWIDWRSDDVSMVSLPGFHAAGYVWFMPGFIAGCVHVVMRMFVSQEAVRLIERHRVTVTFVAPAMLQMMLAEPGVTSATFASLRKVSYGAAPISETLLTRSLEVMGCDFAQIYASTETGTVAVCLQPADHVPGSPVTKSAGRACPGNEIKIVDDRDRELPAGQTGHVCIRTPARMLGYWRQPEATAKTLRGEWLYMGDAGYVDADGYLFLGDRINDTIIVAGQNIYPAEVEMALSDHPAVTEVAVVGELDERWGEIVHACVVLDAGVPAPTPRDLMMFLKSRLADFKIPSRYTIMDELPRNPSGKVLRREVRERLRERQEAAAAQ